MALYWVGDWTLYCELCIGRTCVWTEQGGTDVREQSLEFVYRNIV